MARNRIPGLPLDAEVGVTELIRRLEARIAALEARPTMPETQTKSFRAHEGQFITVEATSEGLTALLPTPSPSNRGARITFNFRNANPVRIESVDGLVNGLGSVIANRAGTFDAISDGETGWFVAQSAGATGTTYAPADATYHLRTADTDLPNARVATASTSIELDYATAGQVKWSPVTGFFTWAYVLSEGNSSGANDPYVAAGQHLGFGDPEAATYPSLGQIRSDRDLVIRAGAALGGTAASINIACDGDVDIGSGADITKKLTLTSNLQNFTVQVASGGRMRTNGPFVLAELGTIQYSVQAGEGALWVKSNAPSSPMFTDDASDDWDIALGKSSDTIVWNATTRLFEFRESAGLSVVGNPGNSTAAIEDITASAFRQVLRVNDDGDELEWGDPVEVRRNGADQGDAYALNFANGTNTSASVSVVGAVANVSYSVTNYPLSGLASQSDQTAVARKAGSAGAPGEVALTDLLADITGDVTISSTSEVSINAPGGVGLQAAASPGTVFPSGFVVLNADSGLRFQVAGAECLEIEADGAWQLNGSTGSANDVMVSQGSSNTPVWKPMSDFSGPGLEVSAGVLGVDLEAGGHLAFDASGNNGELMFRKSRERHFWFEDFDYIGLTGTITTGGANLPCKHTNWAVQAHNTSGSIAQAGTGNNHPGILRMTTGATDNCGMLLYDGERGDLTNSAIRADEIYEIEAVLRVTDASSIYFDVGWRDTQSGGTNSMMIYFDTDLDATVHTYNEEGGATSDDVDTDTAPGTGFNVYTIRQETIGEIDYYIDDVLEATSTTGVPDAETGYIMLSVYTRTTEARSLDIDYVHVETQGFGPRTS